MRQIFSILFLAIPLAVSAQSVSVSASKAELIAASDALAPVKFAELGKAKTDGVSAFIKADMGKGFTAEQREYLAGLYLLTDSKTVERLNAEAPGNFRLPILTTIKGEVVLPFDLLSDEVNYKWAQEDLRQMPVLKRSAADFPEPKPISTEADPKILTPIEK